MERKLEFLQQAFYLEQPELSYYPAKMQKKYIQNVQQQCFVAKERNENSHKYSGKRIGYLRRSKTDQ